MDYTKLYNEKLTTCAEAVKMVQSDWVIGMDAGIIQADGLMKALAEYGKQGNVKGIKVHMMLESYPYEFLTSKEYDGIINGVSWFSSSYLRNAVNNGYADFVPNYYRDIPKLIKDNYEYDVYCASVSKMDEKGNFSFGTSSSYSQAMMQKAKRIVLEVNENQPYAPGGLFVNIEKVDAVVENTHSLPVLPPTELDNTSITIGNLIAEQIKDGSCIQLGIGSIPDAVGNALKTKHDLGIHTEMFTDSMVELLTCGAVNNSKKQIHTGKTVTTFSFGSQRIYDYINNNDKMLILPVDYVNDPNVICKNDNFVSINSCVEVDLWGQVCSESIGAKHLSGSGGQVDYVRGAIQSNGGKSFIAIASTAKNGTISKIKVSLTPGSIVTTSKNDVDYIVTEYGIAHLRGQSLSSRAKQLIAIAHPDFRDELKFEARKNGMIV